jgi:methyl-accepting chemotaxis protein
MLRHPDMPKEAFQDFWQTIQSGKPWFGMVKNKRKNGDYYWVAANASPIFENGTLKGYVSVRYPATTQQKQAAEVLYASIRSGQQSMPWTRTESIWKRLSSTGVGLAFGFAAIGLFVGQTGLNSLSAVALLLAFISSVLLIVTQLRAQKVPAILSQGLEKLANGQFREPIQDRTEWGFALNMVRSRVAEAAAKNYDALNAAQVLSTSNGRSFTEFLDWRFECRGPCIAPNCGADYARRSKTGLCR